MKTYRINQFKTKEEVMDAIIDVFKRREDWCEAEAIALVLTPSRHSRLKRHTTSPSKRWVATRYGPAFTSSRNAEWSST